VGWRGAVSVRTISRTKEALAEPAGDRQRCPLSPKVRKIEKRGLNGAGRYSSMNFKKKKQKGHGLRPRKNPSGGGMGEKRNRNRNAL